MAWRYRYSVNGRPEKVVLGPYPQLTLKSARFKRDELARLVAQGNSPARQKRAERSAGAIQPTMRQFGDRYYREVVKMDRKNPEHLRGYLDKDIFPVLGDKLLREITATDVQKIAIFSYQDSR
jgi:Arm DNA-binding domain